MLEAKVRDVNKKGKTLRNSGLVTGTVKRKNGEIIPISMIGFKLETYIKRNGLNTNIPLTFDNEELKVRIDSKNGSWWRSDCIALYRYPL
mgnify:CR=1 FL=1